VIRTAAVVGTGLIGTSAGLALSGRGVCVHLLDVDESAARAAAARGAGTVGRPEAPVDLAVIAVPPGLVARVLEQEQRRGLARSYTDVASVKSGMTSAVLRGAPRPGSFVGGHPMAGSERSGPLAARADLFEDRPWVLTPTPGTCRSALNDVLAAVSLCGAVPVVMEPEAHDRAVALVSHAPHLVASLMAARLRDAPEQTLRLAGRGVKDVIRVAGGDPGLWTDIARANAPAVAAVLELLAKDLLAMTEALHALAGTDTGAGPAEDALATVRETLARGQDGWSAVHGTEGTPPGGKVTLTVPLDARPGELDRLMHSAAESGVHAQDIRLSWSGTSPRLSASLAASLPTAEGVRRRLADGGWQVSAAALT
jgi:prephenate dehydrogenase